MTAYTTKIGHAHLKVRNVERSIAFYQEYLKLDVIERINGQYAFLSANSSHHEIALQQVGEHAPQNPPYSVGLYHIAFEVPDQVDFARAYQSLTEGGVSVGAVDHLISWAMYFEDPDGNGLEIYWDTRNTPHGQTLWRGRSIPLGKSQILAALDTHGR